MRLIILLASCLVSITLPFKLLAQSDTAIKFSEIVMVDSATRDLLFIKARQWFNDNFKSANDVLQIADKESGELLGKGYVKSYYRYKSLGKNNLMPVNYNLKISIFVKDGKYKYEFSDFYSIDKETLTADMGILTTAATTSATNPFIKQKKLNDMWASMKEELNKTMQQIIHSLKLAMSEANKKLDF